MGKIIYLLNNRHYLKKDLGKLKLMLFLIFNCSKLELIIYICSYEMEISLIDFGYGQ